MLGYYVLLAWAVALILAIWWLLAGRTGAEDDSPEASGPPDPIKTLVDKWAHDWERGRA